MTVSVLLAAPIAGYPTVRTGDRRAATFATLCIACSMVGMSLVSPSSTDLLMVVAVALSGIGAGATLPAMASSIANAVDDRDLGVIGAAQQMVSQLGADTAGLFETGDGLIVVTEVPIEQAQHIQQRGLAGARGAHHRDVLAGGDAQVDAGQRMHITVTEVEHALDARQLNLRCGYADRVLRHRATSPAHCLRRPRRHP